MRTARTQAPHARGAWDRRPACTAPQPVHGVLRAACCVLQPACCVLRTSSSECGMRSLLTGTIAVLEGSTRRGELPRTMPLFPYACSRVRKAALGQCAQAAHIDKKHAPLGGAGVHTAHAVAC